MYDPRQLPLFSTQPVSDDDLNVHTRLVDSFGRFQVYLKHEGKTQHTIDASTSYLALLAEYDGDGTPLGWFTTTRLNDFLSWMAVVRGVSCSRMTYARPITTLKVFFKW